MVLELASSAPVGRDAWRTCCRLAEDFYHIQRQLSEQDAKIAWDSGMAAVDLVKDRVAKYKIDCDLTFGYVDAAIINARWQSLTRCSVSEARGYDGFTTLMTGLHWAPMSTPTPMLAACLTANPDICSP